MEEIDRFRQILKDSRKIVGFTGAGVSTESGIADYRSQGGIWDRYTPVYLSEFVHDPGKRILYWQRKKALWKSIRDAQPGSVHHFFSNLHNQGQLLGIITQNIDGLHEKSGLPSDRLVNLHGTALEIICLNCRYVSDAGSVMEDLDPENPPICSLCQGFLKPNTISFGQQLVAEELIRAETMARGCDLMIAAGSTLQVQPAASYPMIARESGARLAIITLSETPLDPYADFVFHENLKDFLKKLESQA